MRHARRIYPFLITAYPVLALYAHNAGQARPDEALIPFLVLLAAGSALYLLLAKIVGGTTRGGLVFVVAWLVAFSYGHATPFLDRHAGSIVTPTVLLPLTLLLLAALAIAVRRTRRDLEPLSSLSAIVVLTLTALSLSQIASFVLSNRAGAAVRPPELELTVGTNAAVTPPDIYYIILDRYASANTLSRDYQFDNSAFTEFLEQRGFYVARESRANYVMTAQSLASSLNLDHLLFLQDTLGPASRDWRPLYRMIRDNRVSRFLKERGYTFVHMGPEWGPTEHNPRADRNVSYGLLPEFSLMLCKTTIFYPVLARLGLADVARDKWARVNRQMDELGRLRATTDGPLYVFAHFLVPHGPYVFNGDCSFLDADTAVTRSEADNYIGQVECINAKVEDMIERLLAQYPDDRRPVVVVQADEGPYFERARPIAFNWRTASDPELAWKMGILNAVLLPGDASDLYPALTPVNTFRIVFNHFFDTQFPLLRDRSYAFSDLYHIYDFEDISDRVDGVSR